MALAKNTMKPFVLRVISPIPGRDRGRLEEKEEEQRRGREIIKKKER